jgi:hypothetical protein
VLSIGAVAAGVAFVAASFIFSSSRSAGGAGWTSAQASEYQETALQLHELSHEAAELAGGDGANTLADKLANAQAKYDAVRGQLDAARQSTRQWAAALRWLGIAGVVSGVIAYFAAAES